jgi:hypothetical protein
MEIANEHSKDELLALLEDEIPEEEASPPRKRVVMLGLAKDKSVEARKGMKIRITDIEGQPIFKVTCVRRNGKVTLVNKKRGRIVMRGKVVDA